MVWIIFPNVHTLEGLSIALIPRAWVPTGGSSANAILNERSLGPS